MKRWLPRKCRQAVILNLVVQVGCLPYASGISSLRSAQQHRFSLQPDTKTWFKEYEP